MTRHGALDGVQASVSRGRPALALAAALVASVSSHAQDMGGMAMGAPSPVQPDATTSTTSTAMVGEGMGGMKGLLGPYAAMRDASGTAWQPDSSPMEGVHRQLGGWSLMLHGFATLIHDSQGGPRGAEETFSTSMIMAMAQREAVGGELTLRGMFSLDPLMGANGYPLLLQTGETADGRTELVDRQHPHDLFMELAGVYSHPVAAGASAFIYFGLPGEPALGPTSYMHRFSGEMSPEAPIGHHWLDSTHITFGVLTAGVIYKAIKFEASSFTGREPDQHRYGFDQPRFDSWSARATWNPTRDLSLQVSRGWLHSPEQLAPTVDQWRTTASATYNRPLAWRGLAGNWQATLAWGRDENRPGTTTDAYLLESAVSLGRHTLFGRAEHVGKDDLFANQPASPLYGRVFEVAKISLGYAYTVPARPFALDIGGLVSRYGLPAALAPSYGAGPTSFMLFFRLRLA